MTPFLEAQGVPEYTESALKYYTPCFSNSCGGWRAVASHKQRRIGRCLEASYSSMRLCASNVESPASTAFLAPPKHIPVLLAILINFVGCWCVTVWPYGCVCDANHRTPSLAAMVCALLQSDKRILQLQSILRQLAPALHSTRPSAHGWLAPHAMKLAQRSQRTSAGPSEAVYLLITSDLVSKLLWRADLWHVVARRL